VNYLVRALGVSILDVYMHKRIDTLLHFRFTRQQ